VRAGGPSTQPLPGLLIHSEIEYMVNGPSWMSKQTLVAVCGSVRLSDCSCPVCADHLKKGGCGAKIDVKEVLLVQSAPGRLLRHNLGSVHHILLCSCLASCSQMVWLWLCQYIFVSRISLPVDLNKCPRCVRCRLDATKWFAGTSGPFCIDVPYVLC